MYTAFFFLILIIKGNLLNEKHSTDKNNNTNEKIYIDINQYFFFICIIIKVIIKDKYKMTVYAVEFINWH